MYISICITCICIEKVWKIRNFLPQWCGLEVTCKMCMLWVRGEAHYFLMELITIGNKYKSRHIIINFHYDRFLLLFPFCSFPIIRALRLKTWNI